MKTVRHLFLIAASLLALAHVAPNAHAKNSAPKTAKAYCEAQAKKGIPCKWSHSKSCKGHDGYVKNKVIKGKATCKLSSAKKWRNFAQATRDCAKENAKGVDCKVRRANVKGCGKNWSKAKKYKGKGKDYLVCKRSARYKASLKNKADAEKECEHWEKQGESCIISKRGCGEGWKAVRKFKGKGVNYSACLLTAKRKGEKRREDEATLFCQNWERKHKQICFVRSAEPLRLFHKVDKRGCKGRWHEQKRWKGKGADYFACVWRGGAIKELPDGKKPYKKGAWCSRDFECNSRVCGEDRKCK